MSAAAAALLGSHFYGMTVDAQTVVIPSKTRATVVDQRPADIEIAVTEAISVTDAVRSEPALSLEVAEAISVRDEATARGALDVAVSEEINVLDGAVRPTIAVQIDIFEAIAVADSIVQTFEGRVPVEEIDAEMPRSFALADAYPNPANPRSTLRFELPEAAHVRLTIYDAVGREILLLVDREFAPGSYEVVLDGSSLASGTYFYRVQAGSFDQTKSILLSK